MSIQALGWCVALALLLRLHHNTLVTSWLDRDSLAVHEASMSSAVLVCEIERVTGEVGTAAGLARNEVGISGSCMELVLVVGWVEATGWVRTDYLPEKVIGDVRLLRHCGWLYVFLIIYYFTTSMFSISNTARPRSACAPRYLMP